MRRQLAFCVFSLAMLVACAADWSDVVNAQPMAVPAESAPEPLAPVLKIKAPQSIDVYHLVHVQIELSGGPMRELDVSIDPEIPAEDIVRPGDDGRQFSFVAPPGVYTVRVLAIGAQKGYAKQEARLQIRDPRPQAPTVAAAPATPQELIAKWAGDVRSRNRAVEAIEVAKAARETAVGVRDKRIDPRRAVEEWAANAYLRMGDQYRPWDGGAGNSFFANVASLFADNANQPEPVDVDKLLEVVATVLEGGQ